MGRMNELDIEIQEASEEQELDFDKRNYLDGAWWAEQDAEMREAEMKQIESDADIFAEKQGGYL